MDQGTKSWSLAEAVARAGRLRCGELVAVLGPIADVTAAAHASGLAYGDLRAETVRLGTEGDVHLGGPPTQRAAPASDVYALAALAVGCLLGAEGVPAGWAAVAFGHGVPAGLVTALAAALVPQPERRPGADELAAALRAVCDPLPLGRLLPPVPAEAAR